MASYPTSTASFPTRVNGNTVQPADHNDPCTEITAIEGAMLGGFSHIVQATGYAQAAAVQATIAAGVITINQGRIRVETQGGSAADDLDTINVSAPTYGMALGAGFVAIFSQQDAAHAVTFKNGTGNLTLQSDCILANQCDHIALEYNGAGNWTELWRDTASALGVWTTPAFSAGNFTAGGSQTWTVGSGDVLTYRYQMLSANTMLLKFHIDTTTVAGTPDPVLRIALPLSKTATGSNANPCWINDNGTFAFGLAFASAGEAYVRIYRSAALTDNWTAAVNATAVLGELIVEVA